MAGILDFVAQAAGALGQSEESTRGATAALLGGLQARTDPGDFQQFADAIPGVNDLLKAPAEASGGSGGGMLGGLVGQAASAFGGNDLSNSLGVLSAIQSHGFGVDQIGLLVKMLVGFAKSNADESLVNKLLGQVPELAKLAE